MVRFLVITYLLFSASAISASDFRVNGDGTVTDLKSGLVWQGINTTAVPSHQSLKTCEDLFLAGRSDWRLPSKAELENLATHLGDPGPEIYWAISNEDTDEGSLWAVCFGDNSSFEMETTDLEFKTRCVTEEPLKPFMDSVHSWARAWSSRDINAYLSSYSSQFPAGSKSNRQIWEDRRSKKLSEANWIQIELEEIRIHLAGPQNAQIEFVQHYKSNRYEDRVLKNLTLELENGRWVIVREQVLASL